MTNFKKPKNNPHLSKLQLVKTGEDVVQWLYDSLILINQGKIFEFVDENKILDNKAALDYFTKWWNNELKDSAGLDWDYFKQCDKCRKIFDASYSGYYDNHIKKCSGYFYQKKSTKEKLKEKKARAREKLKEIAKKYKPILIENLEPSKVKQFKTLVTQIHNKHPYLLLPYANDGKKNILLKACRLEKKYKELCQKIKDKAKKKKKKAKKKKKLKIKSEWNKNYGDIVEWHDWRKYKIKNLSDYRHQCQMWMYHNMRKFNPKDWKLYQESVDSNGRKIYHIDHHFFPVIEGFKRMTPPQIISHIDNLQLLTAKENIKKSSKIYLDGMPKFLLEELDKPLVISRVNNFLLPSEEIERRHKEFLKSCTVLNCSFCNEKFLKELSKADNPKHFCSARAPSCEGQHFLFTIIQSGIIEYEIYKAWQSGKYKRHVEVVRDVRDKLKISGTLVECIRQDSYAKKHINHTVIDIEKLLIKNAYNYKYPDNCYEGPFQIKCQNCEEVETYSSKYALVYVLGFWHKNACVGKCYNCNSSIYKQKKGR